MRTPKSANVPKVWPLLRTSVYVDWRFRVQGIPCELRAANRGAHVVTQETPNPGNAFWQVAPESVKQLQLVRAVQHVQGIAIHSPISPAS